jgi:hypothetical protein
MLSARTPPWRDCRRLWPTTHLCDPEGCCTAHKGANVVALADIVHDQVAARQVAIMLSTTACNSIRCAPFLLLLVS